MGSMSILHWIILLPLLGVFIIPVAKIFQRAGWSPWLSLLTLVPGVSLVMLWIFAFARWPATDDKPPTA